MSPPDVDNYRRTGFVRDTYGPKWRLASRKGKPIGESSFDGFSPFEEERAWVNIGGAPAFESRHWLEPWMCGAAVGGKWGVIDRKGGWLVEPRFDGAMSFHEGRAFGNIGGTARASTGWIGFWVEGGRWALLDLDGRELAPPRYQAARMFAGGVAWVKEQARWGLIDLDGRWSIEPRFDDVPWRSRKEQSFAAGVEPVAVAGAWGLIDRSGRWVLPPTYDQIFDFREGLALVARWLDDPDPQDQVGRSGLFGFIDAHGVLVHPVTLSRASDFVDGKAAVTLEGRSATLDREGRLTFVGR